MKKNFDFFGIMAKLKAVAAKVKFFFAVLAKVEVFYFFPVALAIVFFAVVIDCVFTLVSGGCPNVAAAVKGIFLFGLLFPLSRVLPVSLQIGTIQKKKC